MTSGKGSFFKSYDRYASSVSLTYLKSGTYQTSAGGVCSIISFIILMYWLVVNIFYAIYDHGSYTVSTQIMMAQDEEGVYPVYEMDDKEFLVTYNIADLAAAA